MPTPLHTTTHASVLQESRSRSSVTAQWDPAQPVDIDGVFVRDVKNVVYSRGMLTELFRAEWFADAEFTVRHVTLVTLSYVVLNDTMFDYEKPDDWVLPAGSDLIPVKMDGD